MKYQKPRPPKWHRHFGNIGNIGKYINSLHIHLKILWITYIFDTHKSFANIQLVHLGVLSAMQAVLGGEGAN